MGDAVRFADPDHPEKGLMFDGRLAEDFKLSSGTWASVGPLRTRFIAAGAPLVQDVVVAGHDRDYIAVLVFPRLDECRGSVPAIAASRRRRPRCSPMRRCARASRICSIELAERSHRRRDPHRARAAARSAALDRRQRDHRQGFHQPARGARASCRAGRGTLRAISVGPRDLRHPQRTGELSADACDLLCVVIDGVLAG